MKTFPTLYKRTKTKAIQYWIVETVDNSSGVAIVKESGQLDTPNPSYHREEVKEGKQKRSVMEQADFQAESDWKKKRDEGYKSLEDLGLTEKEGIYRWNDGLQPYASPSLFTALDIRLPQFNTDSSGNVKPMLATDWTKIKNIQYPCYVEPKLDGVRCLMIVDPQASEELVVTFLSRSGKEYNSLAHINYAVMNYLSTAAPYPNKFVLDGEIYSDELNFQEIVSAVKAYKPNSLKLKFRAYDIVSSQTQMERRNSLKELVKSLESEHIQTITWSVAQNSGEVKKFHDMWVQEGYEGAILRLFDGKYAQGQRSRELLKVKEFDETEFPAIRLEFGQRGVEDLLVVCETTDGREFKAKVQGTLAQKEVIYSELQNFQSDNSNVLATIKHFGFTEDGLPRFPIGKAIRDYE